MSESQIIRNRKYFKRNKILNIIRSNRNISRNDVKKITLYSIPTVRGIIDELIAEGFVREEECEDSRVGRRPVWLHINPEGAYFIGVEFNAARLHCAMLNFAGETVWKSEEAIDASGGGVPETVCGHIARALDSIGEGRRRCIGVCVGVPGCAGRAKRPPDARSNSRDREAAQIRAAVEKEFSLPCYIDSNVNVMAFAYQRLYYKGEAPDFIFVSIRTGVRMVPVVDNRLILSQSGFSGQLGHVRTGGGSRVCSCGRFGCLNSEISDTAVASIIREGFRVGRFPELMEMAGKDESRVTVSMFCESVRAGHPDSIALMRRAARILGGALSTAANIFAPRVIVLSGQLARLGDPFIREVYDAAAKSTVREIMEDITISASALDDYIGAAGAAAYVMQEEFEFIDKQI